MKDDGHDTCRDREEDLRAEVAALREEYEVLAGNAETLHDALQDIGRENERARALLARWVEKFGGLGELFRVHNEPGRVERNAVLVDTRAFLRRDEAPTLTPERCEELWKEEFKRRATECTCGAVNDGSGIERHTRECLLERFPARDEGPRERCLVGGHPEDCTGLGHKHDEEER